MASFTIVAIVAVVIGLGAWVVAGRRKASDVRDAKYDPKLFAVQLQLLDEFIHHLTYRRALKTAYENVPNLPAFWNYTSNAHLLYAAAAWCMVFGAANQHNATHWRKLFNEDATIVASFRQRLRDRLGLNERTWKEYHGSMVRFRDNYVAHRHAEPPPVPNFDIARDVVFLYDEWVRETIDPDKVEHPLLRVDAAALLTSTTTYVSQVIAAVRRIAG